MQHVPVSVPERVTGWFGRSRFGLRPALLVASAVALVAVTYLVYPHTAADSYEREIVNAALGAVVTIAGAATLAALAFWRQLRKRREAARLRRYEASSWEFSALQVGRMRIPGVAVVASCTQGREWTEAVDLEFTALRGERPTDPLLNELREARLPELVERAARAGVPFTNDQCIDVRRASVTLERTPEGRRKRTLTLEPSTASYFDFAVSTARLDEPWPRGAETTLRKHWGVTPTSLTDVERLPALAKVGVGTAVVTKDDRLVLGVRGKTHIASPHDTNDGRAMVHIVAEGMIPDDTNLQGRLDPKATALRGMHEELNIAQTSKAVGRVERLSATGFFFDQQRWQPCFAYVARLDITWDELQTLATAAPDYWEVERLLSLPFDIAGAGIRHLLTGTHPDLVLASNHAAAVVWFALLHHHGVFEMRDALSSPGALGPATRH